MQRREGPAALLTKNDSIVASGSLSVSSEQEYVPRQVLKSMKPTLGHHRLLIFKAFNLLSQLYHPSFLPMHLTWKSPCSTPNCTLPFCAQGPCTFPFPSGSFSPAPSSFRASPYTASSADVAPNPLNGLPLSLWLRAWALE